MNIFIIGAEGVGKTVFLAMMSRFAAEHADHYVLEPVDKASSEYIADKLEILECRKWPVSNPPGSHKGLSWKFGRKGASRTHTISLFDYAGQTMREALLEDDPLKLTEEHKRLLDEIKNADMLIYLLNMGDLIDIPDLNAVNENAWLFHTFVNNKKLLGKDRLVVVTKADLYTGMIEKAELDLRKMIAGHWPKVDNIILFEKRDDDIGFIAVSSVKTDTIIENGEPERIPARRLTSEGFEKLFSMIFQSIDGRGPNRAWRRMVKVANYCHNKTVGAVTGLARTCINDKKMMFLTVSFAFAILLSVSAFFRAMTTEPHQFIFVTGTRDGAGTDGTVTIRIHSQNGGTTEVLFKGDKQIFENGNTDIFERRIKKSGEIVKIDVILRNQGHKPAWRLDQVSIIQSRSGRQFDFLYGNWLGNDEYNEGSPFWEITLRPQHSPTA